MQELEGEKASFEQVKGSLQEELHNERDRSAKQAMALRREIAAVQMNSDEDKRRKCGPRNSAGLQLCVGEFYSLVWFST